MTKKILLGGQAVIEGVMIKSPHYFNVSVRNSKGNIISKSEKLKKSKYRFLQWPFIRGFINLFQMLVIGTKSLIWSANQSSDEEDELTKGELIFTIGFSIFIVLVIFVALPYILTNLIGFNEELRPIMFNVIDGAIKIGFFLLYLFIISYMKDVKILFQYHGAEHKAVYCYEAGKKLTPENVNTFSTLHPRCGTSFIIMVFIISILFFSVLPSFTIWMLPSFLLLSFIVQKLILFTLRIMMIPIIAGTAYELLRLGAKHSENILLKMLIKPGIWLQLITTKQPDKKQIIVAIQSLKNVLKLEKSD